CARAAARIFLQSVLAGSFASASRVTQRASSYSSFSVNAIFFVVDVSRAVNTATSIFRCESTCFTVFFFVYFTLFKPSSFSSAGGATSVCVSESTSTAGGSHIPPKRRSPRRFVSSTSSSRSRTSAAREHARGGFFAPRCGSSASRPLARARQRSCTGHKRQRGDRGEQTVAPSSINA